MSKKHRSRRADWAERPVFRKHQRLTPERLNRIHDHQATRLRHALLGLAGPGVVYGYAIRRDDGGQCRIKKGRIYISCGLAVDPCGRMLYWSGGWVGVSDLAGAEPEREGKYTLLVHYAERRTGSDGRCCRRGAEWVQEGVVFSLEKGCQAVSSPCPEQSRECISTTDYICGRLGAAHTGTPPDEHLRALYTDCGDLSAVGPDHWLYDPNGLSLACVEICRPDVDRKGRECPAEFVFCPSQPEICAHRPYVFRNPLLAELIRGCHVDLARVKKLSWQDWILDGWQAQVAWDDLRDRFKSKGGFTIWFTKPIHKRTLHPASIFLRALIQERRGDYWEGRRIPYKPEYLEDQDGDSKYARGVRLVFEKDWLEAEILGRRSTLDDGAQIELVVRGSLLRDQCGCMLDARPLGFDEDKPGQAMPGDDFVAVFRVAPPEKPTYAEGEQ